MFNNFAKLKSLLLIACLSVIFVACGDDDTATSPSTPKITLDLPTDLEGSTFSGAVPILYNEKYKDLDLSSVSAYLGNFHQDNYIAPANLIQNASGSCLSFTLPARISTTKRFVAYKNLNYNNLDCNPENLGRTTSKVRFFSTTNGKKQYELMIGTPSITNPEVLTKEYHLYFWSDYGTATGTETPYKVSYAVDKGWNITEKDGNNLTTVAGFQGEVMFTIIP